MFSSSFTLGQLGWRSFFAQQLTLSDLDSSFPARVTGVHRNALATLSEVGAAAIAPLHSEGSGATVGDWVLVERGAPRALRLLDRSSVIQRRAAGDEPRPQLIAANLDTLFITSSCNEDFNLSRIERYLALAHEGGVAPVIVLTKADLCGNSQAYLDEVKSIAPAAHALALDATKTTAALELAPWLAPGRTVALAGSSGVGKSTLVNTLLGESAQAAAGIRERDAKGRHTTTSRSMFALSTGAWVIDTPGMRELHLGAIDLAAAFSDIEALARACRFRDCRHGANEGCAVSEAVAAGRLDHRRLANYLKLQREAVASALTVRESRERDRRFGRLHHSAQRIRRRQKEQGY